MRTSKKYRAFDFTNPEEWPYVMKLREVMTVIGCGKNKGLELVQSGELPAKKVRGEWLITKEALLKWLNETTK